MPRENNKPKNIQVRLDDRSNKLLNMLKGELQLQTAKSLSIAEAINMLFDDCRPDLVSKLNQIEHKGQ